MPVSAAPEVIIHLSSDESDVQEAALRCAAALVAAAGPARLPVELIIFRPATALCQPGHVLHSLLADLISQGVTVTVRVPRRDPGRRTTARLRYLA